MIHVPDTNVLLRFAHRPDPQHAVVLSAIRKLNNGGNKVFILPQACVEFWNAFTRPSSRNGFGLSVRQTNHSLRLIEKIFPLFPDDARVHQEWRKLVLSFGVMQENKITDALTTDHHFEQAGFVRLLK